MPKLTLNNNEVEFTQGQTLIQVAEDNGVEIPRFCYHPKLSIAGSCRMCLVEVERMPKLAASCHMPAGDGMVVQTHSEKVMNARKSVMEFLLVNHPLDCPVCDEGGDCDLQDMSYAYGRPKGRMNDEKRVIGVKNYGPIIQDFMTRCIHCTRCVRFSQEIAGVPEMGAIFRGSHMEIGTYIDSAISSELSGNLADICPVGALTSKPNKYDCRTWELKSTPSIDVFDAVGANITVNHLNDKVYRIIPRENNEINETWIGDKTRHAMDALSLQRLDTPYVRNANNLQAVSWEEAIKSLVEKLNETKGENNQVSALAGNMVDVETMFVAKKILETLSSHMYEVRTDGFILNNKVDYTFNTPIADLEQTDACLIVGTNLRKDAPLINARLRKTFLKSKEELKVALVGQAYDLTFDHQYLGDDVSVLESILDGSNEFAQILESAEKPTIIIGHDVLSRADDAWEIYKLVQAISTKYNVVSSEWNGFNVLHNYASQVGGMAIDFISPDGIKDIYEKSLNKEIKVTILIEPDNIDMEKIKDTFIVLIGHHGDGEITKYADIILPSTAYTEKESLFVNVEGRVQKTSKVVDFIKNAKSSLDIMSLIAKALGVNALNIDTDVHALLLKEYKEFATLNQAGIIKTKTIKTIDAKEFKLNKAEKITNSFENYYQSDTISKLSPTMAKCVATIVNKGEC